MVYPPYNPPWYPYDDNSGEIVGNMSNNIVTRYDEWTKTLAPGELAKLIHAHHVNMGYACHCKRTHDRT